MPKILFFILFIVASINLNAQSCEEYIQLIQSKSSGTTYTNENSTAISKVTFYQVTIADDTRNFAIVSFKGKNASDDLLEYIYEVDSNTESSYANHYKESAGKAFWVYIQPFNENLDCAPKIN